MKPGIIALSCREVILLSWKPLLWAEKLLWFFYYKNPAFLWKVHWSDWDLVIECKIPIKLFFLRKSVMKTNSVNTSLICRPTKIYIFWYCKVSWSAARSLCKYLKQLLFTNESEIPNVLLLVSLYTPLTLLRFCFHFFALKTLF